MLYPTTLPGDAGTGVQAMVVVPGGHGYNASTQMIDVPAPAFITSIKVGTDATGAGGTEVGTNKSLTDLAGHLSSTMGITISYSCDAAQPTVTGAGCGSPLQGPFDIITLVGTTSLSTRGSFGASNKYGTLSCLEQLKHSGSNIVVQAGAVAALLGAVNGGTAQVGGSLNLSLIRVSGKLAQLNPNQLYAAGTGTTAFISLP